MKQIAVVAELTFKPEHAETGLNILKSIIMPSRAEKGCLMYELHQAPNNPNTYVMIEKWNSHQDLENHKNSEHIKAAGDGMGELLQAEKNIKTYDFLM